jgi:anti-sigma regulatory factor (Ser/Thr protein kinase)
MTSNGRVTIARSSAMFFDRMPKPARGSRPQVRLSFSIESEPQAPGQARRVLAELERALPAQVLHDLRVVVTELVANAVRFGPRAPIGVSVEVEAGGRVFGEVIDRGRGGAALDRTHPVGDDGLGLQIVDALCVDWGVNRRPSRVWFELVPAPFDDAA